MTDLSNPLLWKEIWQTASRRRALRAVCRILGVHQSSNVSRALKLNPEYVPTMPFDLQQVKSILDYLGRLDLVYRFGITSQHESDIALDALKVVKSAQATTILHHLKARIVEEVEKMPAELRLPLLRTLHHQIGEMIDEKSPTD